MISVYKALLLRQYRKHMEGVLENCSDYIDNLDTEVIQKMNDITDDYKKKYDIASTHNFIIKIIFLILFTIIAIMNLFNYEIAAGFISGLILIDCAFNIYISDKCLAAFAVYNYVIRKCKEKQ